MAIKRDKVEIAKCIINALKETGQEINPKDKNNKTLLHEVVRNGKVEIAMHFINALKETGQEINPKDNHGSTPLHSTIPYDCHVETAMHFINALKESGQEINPKDNHGFTPLHWAVSHGHVEITMHFINALKESGQEINPKDNDGETPLHWAVKNNKFEIAKYIIDVLKKAGQEINPKDKKGNTPLHWMLTRGNVEMVKHFINELREAGQEINLKDNNGNTPWHWAVHHGKLDFITFLINVGADPYIQNNKGQDAFALLETKKDEKFKNDVLECIKQHAYKGAETFLLSLKHTQNPSSFYKHKPARYEVLDMAYPILQLEKLQVVPTPEEKQLDERKDVLEKQLSNTKQRMLEVIFDKGKSELEKNESLREIIAQSNGQVTCTTPLNEYKQNALHLLLKDNYMPPIEWLTKENLLQPDDKGRTPLNLLLFIPSSEKGLPYQDIELRIFTAKKLLEGGGDISWRRRITTATPCCIKLRCQKVIPSSLGIC